MITIETNRLILREYTISDWEAVHKYAQNGAILIYEVWGPNTEKQTKEFIKKAIEDSLKVPRSAFELCITLKSNKKLIGGTGFRIKPDNPQRADFGYIINPEHWNKGYATEASLGLIDYMIKHQGISEIEATCDCLNLASVKVLRKCGLKLMKTVKNDREIKGRMRDTYYFEKRVKEPN